jgi:AraC-like DNA-binding protein
VETEWVIRRPAPRLAALVDRYIGYRMLDLPAGVHRGLPSRHLTMDVSIGPGIDVIAQVDPADTPRSYRFVVGGLQDAPALIAYEGTLEGISIALTPPGCRALFGMPAGALWNQSLELEEVTGRAADELWERLQGPRSWDERFAICDQVLTSLLREDDVEPALRRSWQLVVATVGAAPVGDIARTIGWTRQHLARRFTAEYGLSPKLAGRIVRFDRARRMVERAAGDDPLARIAAAAGYYDQAHMTREFSELAGVPPGRLLRDDLPSVQDAEADRAAASAA